MQHMVQCIQEEQYSISAVHVHLTAVVIFVAGRNTVPQLLWSRQFITVAAPRRYISKPSWFTVYCCSMIPRLLAPFFMHVAVNYTKHPE